jgi:hypothetical protein
MMRIKSWYLLICGLALLLSVAIVEARAWWNGETGRYLWGIVATCFAIRFIWKAFRPLSANDYPWWWRRP